MKQIDSNNTIKVFFCLLKSPIYTTITMKRVLSKMDAVYLAAQWTAENITTSICFRKMMS